MTAQEWNEFCAEKGLDPDTGSKVKVVYKLDPEQVRADNDRWLLASRAYEEARAIKKAPARPKWRLRWVKIG